MTFLDITDFVSFKKILKNRYSLHIETRPAVLSDDRLIGTLSAARRLENRAAYLQTVAIAEFARRRDVEREEAKSRKVPLHCRPGQFPGEELAAELVSTARYADEQIVAPDGTALAHGCSWGRHPWTPPRQQLQRQGAFQGRNPRLPLSLAVVAIYGVPVAPTRTRPSIWPTIPTTSPALSRQDKSC